MRQNVCHGSGNGDGQGKKFWPELDFNASATFKKIDMMYASVGAGGEVICIDWLRTVFSPKVITQFRGDKCNVRNGLRFDIIFVIGKNIKTMISFLEDNNEYLGDKARIACMSKTMPSERARLLLGGFDDVFDISRMPEIEAQTRVEAITLRYAQVCLSHKLKRIREDRLKNIVNLSALTSREMDLVEFLAEREGNIITYDSISDHLRRDDRLINRKHLAVIVHGLRQKLRNGFEICAVRDVGYVLKRERQ